MTVMLLMVVALLYTTIVTDENGLKDQIESHGQDAITDLSNLTTGS
jgi:hypothetical protein